MTGTESTHPKGLVRFTSEAKGQYGLVVQTFVETKCENCDKLHEIDLQHISTGGKAEVVKSVGDPWGWCKECRQKNSPGDYYGIGLRKMIDMSEAEKLYPRGKPGEATEGPLKPGEVYVGVSHPSDLEAMKGGPFECSHGNKDCQEDHWKSTPNEKGEYGVRQGVKITDSCDTPGCHEPIGSHFHYKPTLYSNQILIGTEGAVQVDKDALEKAQISGHHGDTLNVKDEASFIADTKEQLSKAEDILHDFHERFDNGAKGKDTFRQEADFKRYGGSGDEPSCKCGQKGCWQQGRESEAYFDAEARQDEFARAKAKELRNLDVGVTKKYADVLL